MSNKKQTKPQPKAGGMQFTELCQVYSSLLNSPVSRKPLQVGQEWSKDTPTFPIAENMAIFTLFGTRAYSPNANAKGFTNQTAIFWGELDEDCTTNNNWDRYCNPFNRFKLNEIEGLMMEEGVAKQLTNKPKEIPINLVTSEKERLQKLMKPMEATFRNLGYRLVLEPAQLAHGKESNESNTFGNVMPDQGVQKWSVFRVVQVETKNNPEKTTIVKLGAKITHYGILSIIVELIRIFGMEEKKNWAESIQTYLKRIEGKEFGVLCSELRGTKLFNSPTIVQQASRYLIINPVSLPNAEEDNTKIKLSKNSIYLSSMLKKSSGAGIPTLEEIEAFKRFIAECWNSKEKLPKAAFNAAKWIETNKSESRQASSPPAKEKPTAQKRKVEEMNEPDSNDNASKFSKQKVEEGFRGLEPSESTALVPFSPSSSQVHHLGGIDVASMMIPYANEHAQVLALKGIIQQLQSRLENVANIIGSDVMEWLQLKEAQRVLPPGKVLETTIGELKEIARINAITQSIANGEGFINGLDLLEPKTPAQYMELMKETARKVAEQVKQSVLVKVGSPQSIPSAPAVAAMAELQHSDKLLPAVEEDEAVEEELTSARKVASETRQAWTDYQQQADALPEQISELDIKATEAEKTLEVLEAMKANIHTH